MSYEKTEAENWFVKVYEDGTKSASFTNTGQIGTRMWEEMLESGETPSEYVPPNLEKEEQERFNALTYSQKRAIKYPSIGDQLDMQYHDQLNGTTTWKDAVTKVKTDYPKPTE
tara:strand:+ start:453 stop:791 length:339 start_codon:yes stop_codon:yes gene_type:complete